MSGYPYWLSVVTDSKARGNALAAIVGPDVGDPTTFDAIGIPCYPAGTTFTEEQRGPIRVKVPSQAPTHWAIGVAVRQSAYDVAAEYAAGGYPLALYNAGMTMALIDDFRAHVKVQASAREAADLDGFIASLGLIKHPA